MDKPITILLVDDSTQHSDTIKKMLSFEPDFQVIGEAVDGQAGIDAAKTLRPDIVLLDINMPGVDGLEAARQISDDVPEANIIMMTVQDDRDYMKQAMSAGARDYLTKPVTLDELDAAVRRVHSIRRPVFTVHAETAPEPRGKVITVYSPQGGAGCTTLAVNLAVCLMQPGKRVLLVDTDLQFGDVDVLLYMQAGSTLAQLAEKADDLDLEFAENIIPTHDTGLKVLMGAGSVVDALEVRTKHPQQVVHVVEQLAMRYDYVVVDTGSLLDDLTVDLFAMSDQVLMVGTPDLSSVKRTRRVMDLLVQLGEGLEERLSLILNAVTPTKSRTRLDTQRIEKYLKHPILAEIGADAEILNAAAIKGVPLVAYDHKQKHTITQDMVALADLLQNSLDRGTQKIRSA